MQSRYYDANVGRFVNGDEAEYVKIEKKSLSHLLFAYCCNNPINNIDPSGLYYIKVSALAKIVLFVVGFNPIGATLIAIGLRKAKIFVIAKMAILGARLGKFWGPIVCGILTALFGLLGLGVGGQIVQALWDCAMQGKKGIEFTVKKNRWGWPYKLHIYAR